MKMADRFKIPINIGDAVYDYNFNHFLTVFDFDDEYVHCKGMHDDGTEFATIKVPYNLISVELYKEHRPEIFL